MRVGNYYRVSTKLQEKKFSLAAQKEELNKYVKQQGWSLVGEFKDVESGGDLEKEGLNALLDTVEDGKIDVVLVIDQDRLSRLDTIAWEFLKTTLRDNEVKIAEPGNVIDLSNEDDEFISDIKNLIARREKKAVVKRMMRGKRQRTRENKGWGIPPFEYEYDKNTEKYFIKEGWEWVIPFIDDLYLNKQYGMRTISTELNKISKTPTGRDWNERLIHTRLSSKAFHGLQEYEFANGETIAGEVFEPMRTEETYNRIQEEKHKRATMYSVAGRKTTDNIHLLKRINITCGLCGRKIYVQQRGNKDNPRYTLIHGRKRQFNGDVCNIYVNTRRFDDKLLTALKEILSGEDLAKKYIQIDHDEQEMNELKNEVKQIKKSVNKSKQSLDNLLDLYISGSEHLTKERYLAKEKEIKSVIEINSNQSEKLERKIKAIDSSAFTYENLYQFMEIANNIDKELTNLDKAQLMGNLFPRGILHNEKLILITEVFNGMPVEMTIPIGPPLKRGPIPMHT